MRKASAHLTWLFEVSSASIRFTRLESRVKTPQARRRLSIRRALCAAHTRCSRKYFPLCVIGLMRLKAVFASKKRFWRKKAASHQTFSASPRSLERLREAVWILAR